MVSNADNELIQRKVNNIEYKCENTKSGFRFIFYRPLRHKNVQELTKTELDVFEAIKNDNYIRTSQIAERLVKVKNYI